MMTQVFAGAGIPLGLVLLCSCDPAYPIAPTACDDWCFATQRAGCEEDYPEGCVSECEDSSAGRTYPECEARWLELIDCYRTASNADFHCVDDASRPRPICRQERAALAECISPVAGRSCMASCLREVAECGPPERDCEGDCETPTAGCEHEDRALYECRLTVPVLCEGEEQSSSADPCEGAALLLLQCAGF
jgi:hypothetical protein